MKGAKEKQYQSCAKALSVAIIAASEYYHINKKTEEEVRELMNERFKEIQRKYGYTMFLKVAVDTIQKIEEKSIITLNINNKKEKVALQIEPLKKYYSLLTGV